MFVSVASSPPTTKKERETSLLLFINFPNNFITKESLVSIPLMTPSTDKEHYAEAGTGF